MSSLQLNIVNNEDCLATLANLPTNSIDSIVSDPPYGLGKEPSQEEVVEIMKSWIEKGYHEVKGKGFMGKAWDGFVPQPIVWKECLRVLKPGGYLLAFASTRTQDWMAMGLRFGGFSIVDTICWVYGTGRPNIFDMGKAIDKKFGNEREVTNKYEGYSPRLKPANEPIIMAQKPLSEPTYAENILKWGVGALNIPACKVKGKDNPLKWDKPKGGIFKQSVDNGAKTVENTEGRFPANFIYDGSEEIVDMFPVTKSGKAKIGWETDEPTSAGVYGKKRPQINTNYAEEGFASAARFFYCAKPSPSEKELGLKRFEEKEGGTLDGSKSGVFNAGGKIPKKRNIHPTIKPIELMRYLVRLVTPIGGICYDPFGGSGTTAIGCVLEGMNYIISEMETDYAEIATARISYYQKQKDSETLNLF